LNPESTLLFPAVDESHLKTLAHCVLNASPKTVLPAFSTGATGRGEFASSMVDY
jgi:hypothetical protein